MEFVAVFLPAVGVGVIFYFIMRWMCRGDRTERNAQAQAQTDAESWYEQMRERDGENVPFGYPEEHANNRRGLGLRNSLPIRDNTTEK